MVKTDENRDFPKKKRDWSLDFKFRSTKYWNKRDLPKAKQPKWVPETPPRVPTDNPWVDCLYPQPNAPESTQTCHPSVWKYDKRYKAGARYSFGRPFVDKDGWFIFVDAFQA